MNSTRLKRGRRLASLACAATLALPAAAGANVYCVDVSGGDCTDLEAGSSGFANALGSANANAGTDTIRLGAGPYVPPSDLGFVYPGANGPVAIVGAGAGETTVALAAPPVAPGVFTIYYGIRIQGAAGSSVSDLTVTLPSPASGGNQQYRGIEGGNLNLDGIEVLGPDPALQAFGVNFGSGSLTDSIIDAPTATAVASTGNNVSDMIIDRASIVGNPAVRFSNEQTGDQVLRRSTVTGTGSFNSTVSVQAGDAHISDTVIDVSTGTNSIGLDVQNPNNNNDPATVTADHLTIVGGAAGSVGAQAVADSGPLPNQNDPDDSTAQGEDSTLSLTNSVISGPAASVRALADRGETATVTVDHSNYTAPSAFNPDISGGNASGFATLTETSVTTHANPGFVDPSSDDFHLLASSPLIDIGDPAAPAGGRTDLAGDPRMLDGTPDCFAASRRDIGADEFVGTGLLDCIAPDTTVSGRGKVRSKRKRARVTFALGATEAGSSFECSLDGVPFVPCSSPFTTTAKRGAHTLTVRAKDGSGNVDATPAELPFKVLKKKRKKK